MPTNTGFVGPIIPRPGVLGGGSPTVPPSSGVIRATPPPATPGAATIWPVALRAPRMKLRLSAMQNTPYLFPSPYYVSAADEIPFTVTYEGATTVATPVVAAYKNRTDVTSTIFPTNTPTASGNEVTLSTAKAWTSGERYVIEIKATVDSTILVKVLVVIVRVTGGE